MKPKKPTNNWCAWGCGRWTGSWRKKVCDDCEREKDAARSENGEEREYSDRKEKFVRADGR